MSLIPDITVTELLQHGKKAVKIPSGITKINLLYLNSSALCV